MKFAIKPAQPEKHAKDCLLVGIYTNGALTPTAKALDKASKGSVNKMIKQGILSGKAGHVVPVANLNNTKFEHILFIGCGSEKKINARAYRKAITVASKALQNSKAKKVISYLTEINVIDADDAWKVKHHVEATQDALYRFDYFKSKQKDKLTVKDIVINLSDAKQKKACERALKEGEAVAHGMSIAKNLGNTPSNYCTPTFLAEQAKELRKNYSNIKVKVVGENEMVKLGMGALLGVAQGSAEEPQLICIEYTGSKNKKAAPVALVGKGVTFDTGGNSLKPAPNMVGMKYDMCGAASVIGTIAAAAELKLPINVVGIIPAVENMPGGTAYKPEDILTSLSGKTIEVLNTDAEGRLILADALTYCERYKPDAVIDIATLTGAALVALGTHACAVIGNDDELIDDLLGAGEASFDRGWELPMWEEYQEQLKSPFADMSNVGGSNAGTITAACFISRFAEKFKWAHLDVAGTAANMFGTDRYATGKPVPMLMQYLINRAS